jgi:hypothetical protein
MRLETTPTLAAGSASQSWVPECSQLLATKDQHYQEMGQKNGMLIDLFDSNAKTVGGTVQVESGIWGSQQQGPRMQAIETVQHNQNKLHHLTRLCKIQVALQWHHAKNMPKICKKYAKCQPHVTHAQFLVPSLAFSALSTSMQDSGPASNHF